MTGSPSDSCSWTWRVDVAELGVAVGMARALQGLAVRLQAVAHLVEQLRHRLVADRVAPLGAAPPRGSGRSCSSSAGGLRVAPGGRLDERLEVRPQGRVALLDGRASGARPADPAPADGRTRADIGDPPRDRRPGQRRSPGRRPPRRPARWRAPRTPTISRRARSSSSGATARYRAPIAASSTTHRSYHIGN